MRARGLAIVKDIGKLDQAFSKNIAQDFTKWFVKRLVVNTAKKVSSDRKSTVLTSFSADGVNLHHLAHGRNPANPRNTLLYAIFEAMLEQRQFKVRDIVEAVSSKTTLTNAKLTTQVKTITDALVHGNIIRKENHVLCLKS